MKVQPINKFLRRVPDVKPDKPFWSSSAARFCTKELKVGQVDKELRKFDCVVCAVGLRAEESPARAKKPEYSVRDEITTQTLKTPKWAETNADKHKWAETAWESWLTNPVGRIAFTWHPIFNYGIEEVWCENGTSGEDLNHRRRLYAEGKIQEAFQGWPCHWAYCVGSTRLSCSQCVLASKSDLITGAQFNIGTWRRLVSLEKKSGWDFRQDTSLDSLEQAIMQFPAEKRVATYQTLKSMGLLARNKKRSQQHLLG